MSKKGKPQQSEGISSLFCSEVTYLVINSSKGAASSLHCTTELWGSFHFKKYKYLRNEIANIYKTPTNLFYFVRLYIWTTFRVSAFFSPLLFPYLAKLSSSLPPSLHSSSPCALPYSSLPHIMPYSPLIFLYPSSHHTSSHLLSCFFICLYLATLYWCLLFPSIFSSLSSILSSPILLSPALPSSLPP